MAERRDIPLVDLLLDLENPRLEEVAAGQEDALDRLVRSQPEKILSLADDIATHGVSPADSLIVMPAPKDPKGPKDPKDRFIVLEGNRRLTALRLLQRPDAAGDALTDAQTARLGKSSSRFRQRPVETVSSVVVLDRDEAAHWIEMRHRGEMGGAGLVGWRGRESARFAERLGGARNPALLLLDLVEHNPEVSERIRQLVPRVPITNFQRLINDPEVRAKIGIERQANEIRLLYPIAEVLKPLSRIVRQLADEEIVVSNIDTKDLRREYLDRFTSRDLPNPRRRFPTSQDVASLTGSAAPPVSPTRRLKPVPGAPRRTLVPRTTRYNIAVARIAAIFRELTRLDVDDYPNAVAVLFRVFLELSVDHYVLENELMTEEEWKAPAASVAKKIQMTADHLKRNKILTDNELQPVRRALADRRLLAISIDTFHAYVHNKSFSPIPGELRVVWDDLDPFLGAIWRAEEDEEE